jgi:catalase (peroxidase I)
MATFAELEAIADAFRNYQSTTGELLITEARWRQLSQQADDDLMVLNNALAAAGMAAIQATG